MLFIPAKIISVFFSLAEKIFYTQGQSGVSSYQINKQADKMNCIGYKEEGKLFCLFRCLTACRCPCPNQI